MKFLNFIIFTLNNFTKSAEAITSPRIEQSEIFKIQHIQFNFVKKYDEEYIEKYNCFTITESSCQALIFSIKFDFSEIQLVKIYIINSDNEEKIIDSVVVQYTSYKTPNKPKIYKMILPKIIESIEISRLVLNFKFKDKNFVYFYREILNINNLPEFSSAAAFVIDDLNNSYLYVFSDRYISIVFTRFNDYYMKNNQFSYTETISAKNISAKNIFYDAIKIPIDMKSLSKNDLLVLLNQNMEKWFISHDIPQSSFLNSELAALFVKIFSKNKQDISDEEINQILSISYEQGLYGLNLEAKKKLYLFCRENIVPRIYSQEFSSNENLARLQLFWNLLGGDIVVSNVLGVQNCSELTRINRIFSQFNIAMRTEDNQLKAFDFDDRLGSNKFELFCDKLVCDLDENEIKSRKISMKGFLPYEFVSIKNKSEDLHKKILTTRQWTMMMDSLPFYSVDLENKKNKMEVYKNILNYLKSHDDHIWIKFFVFLTNCYLKNDESAINMALYIYLIFFLGDIHISKIEIYQFLKSNFPELLYYNSVNSNLLLELQESGIYNLLKENIRDTNIFLGEFKEIDINFGLLTDSQKEYFRKYNILYDMRNLYKKQHMLKIFDYLDNFSLATERSRNRTKLLRLNKERMKVFLYNETIASAIKKIEFRKFL